jgi:hypothetical protein
MRRIIVGAVIIALLVATNPGQERFDEWLHGHLVRMATLEYRRAQQLLQSTPPGFGRVGLELIVEKRAKELLATLDRNNPVMSILGAHTNRVNLLLFSVYVVGIPRSGDLRVIGIAGNLVVLPPRGR